MKNYGLHAQFSFQTTTSTFADLERVMSGLSGIEKAVQSTATTLAETDLGRQLAGGVGKVRSSVSGLGSASATATRQLVPMKKELRALKAEARNIDFGDLTDKEQFSGAKKEIENYTIALAKLEQQVQGNVVEERELSAALKTQISIAEERLSVADLQRKAAMAATKAGQFGVVKAGGDKILNFTKEIVGDERLTELSQSLGTVQKLANNLDPSGITAVRNSTLNLATALSIADTQVASVYEDLAGAGKNFATAIDPLTHQRFIDERKAEVEQILKNKAALDITTDKASQLNVTLGSIYKNSLGQYAGGIVELNARAGSAINDLADKLEDVKISADDVVPIMNVLMNTIGDAKNFPVDQVAAFSAAVASLGTVEPEAAGSFFNRLMPAMAKNTEGFAKALEMSNDEFDQLVNQDKYQVVLDIAQKYKSIQGDIQKGSFLKGLGIGSAQDQKLIQGMANNLGVFIDARKVAQKGFTGLDDQGNLEGQLSVSAEFGRVSQTAAFQSERFTSAVAALKHNLGLVIQDALIPFMKVASDLIGVVLKATQASPGLTKAIVLGVVVFGGLASAVGAAGLALFSYQQAAATASIATTLMGRTLVPLTGFFETALAGFSGPTNLVTFLGSLKPFFLELVAPLGIVTTQIQAFGAASMAFMVSPVGMAVVGIGLLLTLLEQATPGVSVLGTAMGAIAAPIGFVTGLLKGFTETLLEFVGGTTGKTFQVLVTPFKLVGDAISQATKIFAHFEATGEEVGKNLANFILKPFKTVGAAITLIWSFTIGAIASKLQGFVRFVRGIGRMLLGGLAEASPGPTYHIRMRWQETIDFLKSILSPFVNFVSGIGASIVKAFVSIALIIHYNTILPLLSVGSVIITLENNIDSLLVFMQEAGAKIAQAWNISEITRQWIKLIDFAKDTGDKLVGFLNHGSADIVKNAWLSSMSSAGNALMAFFNIANQLSAPLVQSLTGVTEIISSISREINLIQASFDKTIDKEGRFAARRQAVMEPLQALATGIATAYLGLVKVISQSLSWIDRLTERVKTNIDFFGALALGASVLAQLFVGLILPGTALAQVMAGIPAALARFGPALVATTIATGNFAKLEDQILGIPRALEKLTIQISAAFGIEPPEQVLRFFQVFETVAVNLKKSLADFNTNVLHPLLDGLLNFVLVGTLFKPTGIFLFQAPPIFQGILDAVSSAEFKSIFGFTGEILVPIFKALSGIARVIFFIGSAIATIPIAVFGEMASRAIQAAKGATQLVTALGLPIQVSLSPIAAIKMAIEGISTTARSVLTEVLPSIINRGISSIEVLIIQKLGQLPLGQKVLVPVFQTAFIFLQKHLPNILRNKIFDFIIGVFKRYFRSLAQTFPITSFTDIFLLLPRLAAKSSLGVLMAFLSLAKGAFQVFSLLNPFYLFSQYSKFEKDLVPLITPFDTLKERINKILSSAIFGNLAEQAKKATGALSVQFQAMDRSLNIVAPKIKRLIAFITPGIEAVIQRMSKVQSLLSPIMEGPLAGIVRTLSIMAVRLQFLGGAAVVFSTLYILLKAFDNQTLDTLATVELFGVKLSWLSIVIRVLRNSIIPLTDTLITLAHSGASSFVGLSYILNHLGKSIIPTTLTSMGDALYEVEVGFGQKIAAPMWAVNITKALNVVIGGFKFFVDAIGFSARLIKGILSGIVLGIPVILLGVVDAVLIGAKVGLQGLIAAVQVVGGVVDTALGHLMLYLTAISKRDGAVINKLVQEDIGKPLIAFTQWLQSLVLAGIGKLINGIKSLALIALNWIYSGMLLAGRQAFKFGDALLHPVRTIKTLAVWAGILAAKVGVIAIAFLTLTQFIPNLASFTGKLQSVGKAATIVGNVAEVALGGAGVAATTASFAVAPLITGLLAMGALVVALGIEYKRGFKEIHATIAALETPIASVTGMFFRLIGIITGPINIPLFDKISQFIGFFVDLAKKVIPIAILAFVGFQFASRGPIEAIRAIGKAIVTLVQGIGWLIASLLKFGKTAAANPLAQLIGKQAVVGARSVSPVGGFASVGQKDLAKADIAAVKASLAFRKQAEGEIRRVKKESEALFIRGALSESAVAREQYGKYVETVEKRTLFGVKKVHQLTQAGKVAQEKLVASDVLSENRLRGMSRESGLEVATEKSGTTLSVPQLRKIASQNQPQALRDLIEDFDAVFAAQAEMERMDVKQMEVSTLKILGLPDGIMGASLDKAGSPKVTTEKKLADILELEVSLDDMRQLGGMTDLIKELGGEAGKTSVRLKDLTTKQLKKLAEGHGVTPQLLPEIPSKGTGADYYKKLGIEDVERQLIAIQLLHTQELPNVSFKHSDMSSEILTAGDIEPKIDPIRDASSKLARIDKLNQLLDGLESFKGFAGYDLTPSTQAGVMVPKMQEELTAGISAGTPSFQYAKYGVIKDLLEHQRDRILAEMGEITQTITVQEAKTAEGIAAEIPKFKRKGLFERVKAGIAQLGQAIRERVASGIQGIKASEFVQSQAAQQSISKEEALAKKRRELIEQAIANMGMKPSQDLEVLSTLGASASKRETSGRIADFVNPANIDKIIPHIKLPTGHTLKEVTELFKGVKKERLKQMAARNGLEPYLEVLASNLNMGYETLLNQIKEGTTGIAGSLTQAVNQFMADLELSPSVGRTESTYIKGLKGLADQLKDKTQGEIINFLKKNKPSLQGRSYYEYLSEAIQNRFDLDPSDVSKIDKVIASSLTPSKRVNPNHNTAQLKRFYQLLKEGGMIDKDPERLWGNLMAKYSTEVNRINDGIVKYEDKTPLVTALKEYLKRKGKVDEDSFNSLIQSLAQGKSFQGTFIKLIETGYVEELKTLEAAEKHFGFKPAIHETQTEQFAAKQKVLQGYLNSPDILFAIEKGDISKDEINNLLMELAKKANIELDQLINPLINSEDLKSAHDLRIKKVSELTDKLKTTPEAVLDPDQLKFIYSGKFYQIADVEIQEIATLLGYADKGSNTAKEQLIKDLSTIELLKSRSGAKAQLGRLAVRLLKIPLDLFGITAISKATQYTHEVNQVLSASVRIEQNRIAQEQKQNDLLLKQKEIRQKALDAAIVAAKLSKKSFIAKLTPKLQEIVKNFIDTGNFIEKIPEEVQQKLAKAMGGKLEISKLPELHKALAEYEENYTDTTGIERTRQVDLANPFAKFMKQQGQLTEKQMRSIQSVLGELGINIEGSKIADLEKSFKKFRGKLQPKDLQSVLQTLLKSGGFDKELELKSSEIQEIANALKIDTTKLKEIGDGKFELDTINRLKFQIATFFETLFQGFKDFRKNFRAKAANIKLFGLGDKVFTPFIQNFEKTVTSVNQRFKQASTSTTKLPFVKQFLSAKAKQQTDSGKSLQTLLENAEFQGSPQVFAEKYTERVGSVLAAKDLKMPEELIHKAMAAIFSPSEKGLREDLKAATAGMKNQDLLAEVITEAFGDTLKLTTQEAQKYLEPKGLSAKTTRPLIAYLASEIPDLLKQIGDLSLKAIRAIFNDMIKAVGAPINRFIGRAARGAAETAAIAVNQLRGFFPSQTKGVGKYITKLEELLLNTGLGVQKYLETQASALSAQRSVIRSILGNSFKLMFFGFKLIVGAVKQTSKLILKAGRRLTPMVKGINWKELFGGYRKLIGKVIGGVRHLFTKVTPAADRAAQTIAKDVAATRSVDLRATAKFPVLGSPESGAKISTPPQREQPGYPFPVIPESRYSYRSPALPTPARLEEPPTTTEPKLSESQRKPGILQKINKLISDLFMQPAEPYTIRSKDALRDKSGAKLFLGSSPPAPPASPVPPTPPAPRVPQITPTAQVGQFIVPPAGQGLPTAPVKKLPTSKNPLERTFGAISDALITTARKITTPAVKEVTVKRLKRIPVDPSRILPPVKEEGSPLMPEPSKLGTRLEVSEETIKPLFSAIPAAITEKARSATAKLALYFANSAMRSRDAWAKAQADITNTHWTHLVSRARIVGTFLVESLNHGAADVTAQAWDRTEQSVEQNMHAIHNSAAHTGQQMAGEMKAAATSTHKSFLGLVGRAGMGIGKTGFAAFGALSAAGFAAQSAVSSLSTMGLVSEESGEKLNKFLEVFTLIGTIGSIVAPMLELVGSLFGTIGSLAALVLNPVTLTIAAVVGGVILINAALKKLFGIDLLEPIFTQIQQPFAGAVTSVEGMWAGFVERYGEKLLPIVQPAIDIMTQIQGVFAGAIAQIQLAWTGFASWFTTLPLVQSAIAIAQGLIAALNCHPTEAIPEAWAGAVAQITGFLSGLPIIGNFIGGKLTEAFNPGTIFGGLFEGVGKFIEVAKSSGLGNFFSSQLNALQKFLGGMKTIKKEKIATVATEQTTSYAKEFETAQKLASAQGNQRASEYLKSVSTATGAKLTPSQFQKVATGKDIEVVQAPASLAAEVLSNLTAVDPTTVSALKGLESTEVGKTISETSDVVVASGRYLQQAVHLQEARERSDQAMAAVMAGWKAVSGQGSFKEAAEAGAVARDAYAQTALGKQITDVKQRAGQMAGTVAQSFQDRMDYLAHTKGAFVGELFEPGIKEAKQGLDVFVGDLGHFVGEAGNALLHLDFNGVAKAAVDFGGNAAAAFQQIAGGLSSASLSMVAFGFYSLLSLSPITLALGGLAIAALAVATNFLGMRYIVFGLAKMALGATMVLFSLGRAIFGIGQGLGMIARGILNLNFDLIKQGTLRVWDAIKQGAIGLKDALAKIFSGFGETIKGVFQGIGQIILAPFGGVKIAFSAIASSARFLGGTLRSIIYEPKQLWQDFLELLEKIKVRIISVTESIGDSAVGRLVRGVKKKVGGQPSDSKDVTTTSAPVPVPEQKKGFFGRVFGRGTAATAQEAPIPIADTNTPVSAPAPEQKKGFFGRVFGRGTAATAQEAPIPIADTNTPVSAPAPEQKQGFFGRVFGRGTAATAQEAPIPIADTNTPVSAPVPEQKQGFFGRVFGRGTAATAQKAPIPIADTTTPAPISDSQPGIQQVLGRLFSQSSTPTKSQEVLEQTKDGLNSASNALSGLGRVASLVSPGLAEPIQGLSELTSTLSGFCDITSFAQKAIPVVTGVLGNLGLIFNALKAQILGFIIPLIPAIIPILPIIAAIAVAAGLLYLAFKTNFLGIGDFIDGVIDAFKTFLGTLFGGAWDAIASVFTTFGNSLGNILNALVELGSKIIKPFQPLLNLFGGGSDGFFGSFIKNVVNGILLPLRLMVGAINTAVNILGFVITLVIQIGNFFTTLWLVPIQLVMNGLGTLFGFFSNIFGIVMSIGKAIADFVMNPLNALGNAVGGIASFFGIGGGNNSPEEVGNLQTFHSGGLISGSGETLVKAQAGEFVVTPEATRSNLGVLRAINAGQNIQSIAGTAASSALSVLSPILPQIPEAPEGAAKTEKEGGGSSEAGGQTFVYSINIENLTIHTSGETSEQMAADMFEALRPHLLQLHRESGRHNVTYLR